MSSASAWWCGMTTPTTTPSLSAQALPPPLPRRRRARMLLACSRHMRALALLLLPPAVVIAALHISCPYALLAVCQLVLTLGALELSWWHFRIRKRLLIPLRYSNENLSHAEFVRLRFDEMHPSSRAVTLLADRLCRGKTGVAALLVSAITGGAIVALVVVCKDSIVDADTVAIGWHVVVSCTALGATLSTLCSCFAPTACDALAGLVYQSCFTISTLNTFLAHTGHLTGDPTMLDSLYVVLVGACVLVVWRIVTSDDVLETTLALALDLFGLVFLASSMMEVADFFHHQRVAHLSDKVATFWLVVCAAEVGHYVHIAVRTRFPRAVFPKCQTSLVKGRRVRRSTEDFVVAVCSSAAGLGVAWLAYPTHRYEVWELAVLALAALLSQVSRLGLATMKDVAMVGDTHSVLTDEAQSTSHATSGVRVWHSGVMTLMSPYLVAAIAFHPYIKSLYTGVTHAATGASGSRLAL